MVGDGSVRYSLSLWSSKSESMRAVMYRSMKNVWQ